jgi:hypothetical protein
VARIHGLGEFLLKSLDFWPGRQPTGPQGVDDLGNLLFADRGTMKRDSEFSAFWSVQGDTSSTTADLQGC